MLELGIWSEGGSNKIVYMRLEWLVEWFWLGGGLGLIEKDF